MLQWHQGLLIIYLPLSKLRKKPVGVFKFVGVAMGGPYLGHSQDSYFETFVKHPNHLNRISLHSDAVEPIVTIRSVTAKSIGLSFSEREFSLPISQLLIIVTRVTGSGQELCPRIRHQKVMRSTSRTPSITDLEEFSVYTIAVNVSFERPGGGIVMLSTTLQIAMTSNAGMKCSL